MNAVKSIVLALTFAYAVGCSEFPEREISADMQADIIWKSDRVPQGKEYADAKGKLVKIEGEITRILNKGGTPTIRLDRRVLCALPQEYVKKLESFAVGQRVVVLGKVSFVPNPQEFDAYLSPALILDVPVKGEAKGAISP